MRKLTVLILFICLPMFLLGQELERVQVKGKITAPAGDDVEGVSVYNISSQKGTVTGKEGDFELAVSENDRVQVTAIQFRSFTVVVDAGVVISKNMSIYLNPVVNVLDEVIVRPYDLSGNIVVDVGSIKTAVMAADWDMSYEALEFGYEFADDSQSTIKENAAETAYLNGQTQNGMDFIGLFNLLTSKKKKKSVRALNASKDLMANSLRSRFSNAFIAKNYKISEDKAADFIYFAEENGMQISYLYPQNEIRLLEFMRQMSVEYKLRSEEE